MRAAVCSVTGVLAEVSLDSENTKLIKCVIRFFFMGEPMEEGDPVCICCSLSTAQGWHSAAEEAFIVWTVSPPPVGGEGWQTG